MPSFTPLLKRELAHVSRDETGQTIIEYTLVIILVALGVLLASPSLTAAVAKVFADTSSLMGYRS